MAGYTLIPDEWYERFEPHTSREWLWTIIFTTIIGIALTIPFLNIAFLPFLRSGEPPASLRCIVITLAWGTWSYWTGRLIKKVFSHIRHRTAESFLLYLARHTRSPRFLTLVPGEKIPKRELLHYAGLYLPSLETSPVTLFLQRFLHALQQIQIDDVVILSLEYRVTAVQLRLRVYPLDAERLHLFKEKLMQQLGSGGVLCESDGDLLLTIWGLKEIDPNESADYDKTLELRLVPLCTRRASRLHCSAVIYVNHSELGHVLIASPDRKDSEDLITRLMDWVNATYRPEDLKIWALDNNRDHQEETITPEPPGYAYLDDMRDLGAEFVSIETVSNELRRRMAARLDLNYPAIAVIVPEFTDLYSSRRNVLEDLITHGPRNSMYLIAGTANSERVSNYHLARCNTVLATGLYNPLENWRLVGWFGLYMFSRGGYLDISTRITGHIKAGWLPYPQVQVPQARAASDEVPDTDIDARQWEDRPADQGRDESDAFVFESGEHIESEEQDEIELFPDIREVRSFVEEPNLSDDEQEPYVPTFSTPYYLSLLGDFRLLDANHNLLITTKLGYTKPMEMCAYLATRRGFRETKQTLINTIWECEEKVGTESLNSAISDARAWFSDLEQSKDAPIKTIRQGRNSYRCLDIKMLTIDAYRFKQQVGTASTFVQSDPAKAIGVLRETIKLYQGDFMPGLEVGWAVRERRELLDKYISALNNLIKLTKQYDQHSRDISALEEVLVRAKQRRGSL